MTAGTDHVSNAEARDRVVDLLRATWIGPVGGAAELVERNPVFAYLVGVLFPVEVGTGPTPADLDEDEGAEGDGIDDDGDEQKLVDEQQDDELSITGAFGWAPQSMALSVLHTADGLTVSVTAGSYESEQSAGASETWRRVPLETSDIELPATAAGSMPVFSGRAKIAWRTRATSGGLLTTVAISNASTCEVGAAKSNPAECLFQVQLSVTALKSSFLPYPTRIPMNSSPEDRELELRYRDKVVFGVGHGVAVDWDRADLSAPTTVRTDVVPSHEVPAIRAALGRSEDSILNLATLADESVPVTELARRLRSFVGGYSEWIGEQRDIASRLDTRFDDAAGRVLTRMSTAEQRMSRGIDLLESSASETVLRAFRLANEAMRLQMIQQSSEDEYVPRWRPFQLGFILLSLASTVDETHEDREVVDLIWFPTGGGKTEAYLALAAIEMIRRRLDSGVAGGGTAVITRYTMRLLTAQQFQRAASLICALEVLRESEPRLSSTPPFSIGLWLGNETTPATYKSAASQFGHTLGELVPENRYQLRVCPWCGTDILPSRRTADQKRYGIRASAYSFAFFCPRSECRFHDALPVQVVDEALYDDPPTMLVATVDKFARLAWNDRGGSLFGLGPTPYAPPSLVIQDELHLIAGPLGTIVGVYEAALRGLLSWSGGSPKVVASTATIRASEDQVRELLAAEVEVFPPSGLDADDSYFAEPDPDRPGRTYVGVMPQAHTPAWATGQVATSLLQAPIALSLEGAVKDSYWTLVVYHNSLRELGRSMTILRDDVGSNLAHLHSVAGLPTRSLGRDGVVELNGNVKSEDLVKILDQLNAGPGSESPEAIDALATTNILSVGIDVARLGLMLVNGQPKSTSEYIQATSRVGRGAVPGLVVTMYRSGKPRDRSVFESFHSYHESYYRFVEPATLTPWSVQARRRAIRAALVILMRHGAGLNGNDDARYLDPASNLTNRAVELLHRHVSIADPREADAVLASLRGDIQSWASRIALADAEGLHLKYKSTTDGERLLKSFTDTGAGWPTMHSMRSVDRAVKVKAQGER